MKKKKQDLFLKEFELTGTIKSACEAAKIDRTTFYNWKKNEPKFAQRFEDTDLKVTNTLEDCAMERAKNKSDSLLIFLLKSRRPLLYRDRFAVEHSGEIENKSKIDMSKLTTVELKKLAEMENEKK